MAETNACLNCGRTSQERHLLVGEHEGKQFFVCADCLPYLIHQPETIGRQGGANLDDD